VTKKDYIAIAAALHRSRMAKSLERNATKRAAAVDGVRLVAIDLSATLAADNPRFDRKRFLAACGVER